LYYNLCGFVIKKEKEIYPNHSANKLWYFLTVLYPVTVLVPGVIR